jgi:two-component system chemotaxis response regulator CheY
MQESQRKQFNFLVVDDSEFARKTLIKILITIGGKLAGEATSGQDAVQKYRNLKPDIVFMDITMPGMEGIDALEKIIRTDSSARVVMVSSLSHKTLVQDALKKGAKHFITKPVRNESLEEIVQFVLTH